MEIRRIGNWWKSGNWIIEIHRRLYFIDERKKYLPVQREVFRIGKNIAPSIHSFNKSIHFELFEKDGVVVFKK